MCKPFEGCVSEVSGEGAESSYGPVQMPKCSTVMNGGKEEQQCDYEHGVPISRAEWKRICAATGDRVRAKLERSSGLDWIQWYEEMFATYNVKTSRDLKGTRNQRDDPY